VLSNEMKSRPSTAALLHHNEVVLCTFSLSPFFVVVMPSVAYHKLNTPTTSLPESVQYPIGSISIYAPHCPESVGGCLLGVTVNLLHRFGLTETDS
jgi:hypothetical protein